MIFITFHVYFFVVNLNFPMPFSEINVLLNEMHNERKVWEQF